MRSRYLTTCLLILILAGSALADRRKQAFTYGYSPSEPGMTELELYQTTQLADPTKWEFRFELEHGLSDKLSFAFYQIFQQTEGSSFTWDAVQFRTIYQLSAPGRLPLNLAWYLEYVRPIDLKEQNELETKIIAGRDFGKLSLALNPVYAISWAPGEPSHEIGLDAAVSTELSYSFTLGAEVLSRAEFVNSETEKTLYAGPTMSFAKGKVYYTFSYVWGLTDESDDARARFLIGIEL